MKTILLALLFWLITAFSFAQTKASPGGVGGAVYWFVTEDLNGKPIFRNRGVDTSEIDVGDFPLSNFNFHPSLVIKDGNEIKIPLKKLSFNSSSFFSVYRLTDTTSEDIVWHIETNKKADLVVTTNRAADLSTYHYMNFIDRVRSNPKVSTYLNHIDKDLRLLETTWHLGSKPLAPNLPINPFNGTIPEVIAYNRVITWQERVRVASYLAIKYGITLTEPDATYLNSFGNKIWTGQDYTVYHNDIAGIIRDNSSGLYQRLSSSSNKAGLFTVSTKEDLPNNVSLLWGHNAFPLMEAEKVAGRPRMLERKWLFISTGNSAPFITDIAIDTKEIDAVLPGNPVYWLAIDTTGSDKFNLQNTYYIKMSSLNSAGIALFSGIKFNQGKATLALSSASEILLSTDIKGPTCFLASKGSVELKLSGGVAPYRINITDKTGSFFVQKVTNDSQISTTDVGPGKYYITVLDDQKHFSADSFLVNYTDGPEVTNLESAYTIPKNGSLMLNAEEKVRDGVTYAWKGPDNFQTSSAVVDISKPGNYLLTTSLNGCSYIREVLVKAFPVSIISDYNVTLYPNPSFGLWKAKVVLERIATVTMAIYNSDGKLIKSVTETGRSNYNFAENLTTSGVYKVVFSAEKDFVTKRLIIAR